MVRLVVVLHAVPYVKKNSRLENTQSGMFGSNSETGQVEGFVVVWAKVLWDPFGAIIKLCGRITAMEYVDSLGNPLPPINQKLFPKTICFTGR